MNEFTATINRGIVLGMRKLKGYFILHRNKLDTPLKNTETPTGIGSKIFSDHWVKIKDFQKITSHR